MLYFAFNMLGQTAVTDSTKVQNCAIADEINLSSTFAFDMHVSDQAYQVVQPKITYVTVYDDISGGIVFRGRVTTTKEDSSTAMKSVTCNDALDFLNDSFYIGQDAKKGASILGYLNNMPIYHNQILDNDPYRKFAYMSIYTNVIYSVMENTAGKNPHNEQWYEFNGSSYFLSSDTTVQSGKTYYGTSPLTTKANTDILNDDISICGERSFDVLRSLVEAVNWEFKLSYIEHPTGSEGHFKISVAPYFGFKARTPIVTGLNLKSLTKDRDFGEFYTRIYPVGGYGYDEKRLYLLGETAPPDMTWYDAVDQVQRNQYVDNVKLREKYGIYPKRVIYDNIVANTADSVNTARHNLYATAYKDAMKLNDRKETINVSGYDLHKAGYPVDELKVGNWYQCIDEVTNTVVKARLKKMTRKYDKPFEPDITLEYDGLDEDSEVE